MHKEYRHTPQLLSFTVLIAKESKLYVDREQDPSREKWLNLSSEMTKIVTLYAQSRKSAETIDILWRNLTGKFSRLLLYGNI
jgi:hypothetical protein